MVRTEPYVIMIDFCHIVPTPHFNLVKDRPVHLVLAHLVEEDEKYCENYRNSGGDLILDNSAFEMYKRNQPMYPTSKLIEMAKKVGASYVVMSDYPRETITKTMNAAMEMIPQLREADIGTFYCPQAEPGDLEGLIASYAWAFHNPGIDYVAFSILNIPLAYNCESGTDIISKSFNSLQGWRMQKFLSRWKFMIELDKRFDLKKIHDKKKFHFLGMTEGPNEIQLMRNFSHLIDTWDSSAAVWAGLNGIKFDNSPTGLINGKFEKEVDFNHACEVPLHVEYACDNMEYIDELCGSKTW